MNLPFGNAVAVLFCSVFLLLLIATLTGVLLQRSRSTQALHDYFQRLTAWWWVAGFMLLVALAGRWAGSALFLLLVLAALRECWRALHTQPWLFGVAALLVVLGLAHLFFWLAAGEDPGLLRFSWLILLTQLNDIAQYFAGKALGRRKLAPRLSPNKTWEGVIGGLLFTSLASAALSPLLLSLSLLQSLAFGLLVGATGVAGDLAFSALKRRAGIKDFGRVLPGQGGIMDRLDSLTFTAPACFHFIRLITS